MLKRLTLNLKISGIIEGETEEEIQSNIDKLKAELSEIVGQANITGVTDEVEPYAVHS